MVDRYLTETLIPPDPIFEETLRCNAAAGLSPHDVAPNQGKLLYLLARIRGARRILEIGTLGGYSTLWMARALPADGILITLEVDPRHAVVAAANITRSGLGSVIDVRVGPALESLARLSAEGAAFDLIFLDADKANNPSYLEWALRLSRAGTILIADNVVRGGDVVREDSPDPAVQGMRRFFEMLATEPRLEATALQTVGSKGHDGFVLALVTR